MDFKVPVLPAALLTKTEGINDAAKPSTAKNKLNSACPYKVPKWSQPPDAQQDYKFEVLKSGQIIDEVKQLQKKAFWSFGRLPDNDVVMAHPTISRYHAVLQYKPRTSNKSASDEEEDVESNTKHDQPEGWYIYDLGSTHGTFLNKQRIPSHVFIRIRVGHMLKMGSSTRVYILQGPGEDEEPESEFTITELREQRDQQVAAAIAEKERETFEAQERERNEGANWGMAEDADEETDLTHNPYASTNNEELFFDDPKRTLRGFFEREGLNLEYKCDELSQGSFVCRVELPIDDSNGRSIIVEVTHKGRKKDCVVQCALEACRTLDRHGVLRQANQESQKRKYKKADDSEDEDEFWDRTGDVARKKQRKANTGASTTLTYDDLLKKDSELANELRKVEQEITAYQQNNKRLKELTFKQRSATDDLDNFMDTLAENITQVDKTEIKKLRLEQQRIKAEQQKVQRLIKIAKPTTLPFSVSTSVVQFDEKKERKIAQRQMPMIGKRNKFSTFKVVKPIPSSHPKWQTRPFASDDEEFEEEEVHQETPTENNEKMSEPEVPMEIMGIEKLKEDEDLKGRNPSRAEETMKDSVNNINPQKIKAITSEATTSEDAPKDMHPQTLTKNDEDNIAEEAACKKRRQRARQRSNKQRQDIDMDQNELADHDDSEKYAKWVPPTNQSGDGFTHLNDKFGY